MTDKVQQPIAVSKNDYGDCGCPYCGYRSGYSPISGGGTAIVVCGECERSFAVLAVGVTKSTIGFGEFYPELQPHPRKGTLAHGRLDKRPEGGGEFFQSRGIGYDSCTCFVCGTKVRDGRHSMLNNIAAFVQCREAGVRVVAMFRHRGRVLTIETLNRTTFKSKSAPVTSTYRTSSGSRSSAQTASSSP